MKMEQQTNVSVTNIDYSKYYIVSINKDSVYNVYNFMLKYDALRFADDKLREGYTVKIYYPKNT